MLDREDQQMLERNIELRDNAIHRTISMTTVVMTVFITSAVINNPYSYIAAIIVATPCIGYSMLLVYRFIVAHRATKPFKQRAKHNERAFSKDMDAFLESVGRAN